MVHSSRVWRYGALPVLVALALTLSMAGGAHGQSRVTDSVQIEMERTDRVIATAGEAVGAAASVFSHQELNSARSLQSRARKQYVAGEVKVALKLTLESREHAINAIDAARVEERATEDVRRSVDAAQERIADVAARVEQSGNALARRVLDQGIDQIQRARRALASGNIQQASRLAGLSLGLIERAGRMAEEQITAGGVVQTSIERTSALLAEAGDLLAASDSADSDREKLHEAQRLLQQARDLARRAQNAGALRLSLRARKIGLDLLAELRAAPDTAELESMLDELSALLADTSADVRASGNPEAIGHLSQAEDMLAEARELIQDGQPREALRALVAAESLLREAADEAAP